MALSINPFTAIVSITVPQNDMLVQDFVNTVRDFEDDPEGIVHDKIIDAVGKADLGGGIKTGIVCTLNPTWQTQFWNGVTLGVIRGGNLVGGIGGNPVKPTGGPDTIKIINDVGGVITVTGSGVLPGDIVAIADAVNDELLAGHPIPDSLSMWVQSRAAEITLATKASQASVDDLDTDLIFVRRFFTNKKTWDDALKRWDIYDDAGVAILYHWKPRTKAGADVTMAAEAFAASDKVAP